MSLMDSYENAVLNFLFRNVAMTPPTTVYIGLYTAAPNDAGTGGTEVSGGAYARQVLTFSAASAGAIANSAIIEFPEATASWGTVTTLGIFDAATAGNLLATGSLTSSVAVASGNILRFPTSSITVSLD